VILTKEVPCDTILPWKPISGSPTGGLAPVLETGACFCREGIEPLLQGKVQVWIASQAKFRSEHAAGEAFMRRALIVLVILAVLAVAGVWAYQNYFAQTNQPLEEQEEAVVERGSLVATVNATGTILPERQTTLSFNSPGRVAEVLVVEGEAVSAGQVLARLETRDLEFAETQAELAVHQAELSLTSAQVQLLRVQRDPAEYDIAAAEAAVESARATYRRLVAGPSEEEIQVARASLDQAKASLDQVQQAYNQVADRPDVALLPQALQLEQATIAYEAAQASFELAQRDPTEAELSAARSAIVQAEASLSRLQEDISDEDLLVAQLAVEQAQLGVEQAQLSLDQARHQLEGNVLTAPHDGVVTLVAVKPGELSGGQPAFLLTDLSQFHVDLTVDEIDIGRVFVGQAATFTLDALPGETLAGQVDEIAQTAEFDSGVVTFKVTIRLAPTEAPLRVGMTANVDIVAERREDVLLIPNRFIRIDRATGQAFVDRLAGAEFQSIEIQIGLRDEVSSEVLAGLDEGDLVVLVKESSRDQLRGAFQMGPP
jgi:HlyD family secretion protein